MDDWMRCQVRLECLKITKELVMLPEGKLGAMAPLVGLKEVADDLFAWVMRQPPGKPVMVGAAGGRILGDIDSAAERDVRERVAAAGAYDLSAGVARMETGPLPPEAHVMLEQAAKTAHQRIDDAVGGFTARTRNL